MNGSNGTQHQHHQKKWHPTKSEWLVVLDAVLWWMGNVHANENEEKWAQVLLNFITKCVFWLKRWALASHNRIIAVKEMVAPYAPRALICSVECVCALVRAPVHRPKWWHKFSHLNRANIFFSIFLFFARFVCVCVSMSITKQFLFYWWAGHFTESKTKHLAAHCAHARHFMNFGCSVSIAFASCFFTRFSFVCWNLMTHATRTSRI